MDGSSCVESLQKGADLLRDERHDYHNGEEQSDCPLRRCRKRAFKHRPHLPFERLDGTGVTDTGRSCDKPMTRPMLCHFIDEAWSERHAGDAKRA